MRARAPRTSERLAPPGEDVEVAWQALFVPGAHIVDYLRRLHTIRSTGESVTETSFYGALEALLNAAGDEVEPRVSCVLNPRSVGHGIADVGLFTAEQTDRSGEAQIWDRQVPSRGVVEAKGPVRELPDVVASEQVARYLEVYGRVLVTNLRGFQVVRLETDGRRVEEKPFLLAASEAELWRLARAPEHLSQDDNDALADFLRLTISEGATVTRPEHLAWYLAAYARSALRTLGARRASELTDLRKALERAVGVSFSEERQARLFRSTLVQTLFYSIFAAWVLWASDDRRAKSEASFDWRTAAWELDVPVVRALFERLATPGALRKLGLVELLDRAGATLNRVEVPAFFERFETDRAIEYFYEPFLAAFDPELRKELGVWYTPGEVVDYMVERVDQTLREEFGFARGLADPDVTVLDPCVGTGSYLVAVLDRIERTLRAGGDALVAAEVRQAATSRIFGFELLPAPLVIAHLQMGLRLRDLGAPLSADREERAGVFLTNALVGWEADEAHVTIQIPELAAEHDAAKEVKQRRRILVILGNPPYNAFAGTSPAQEAGLLDEYKAGVVTRNTIDDLYVRFWRVAQQRIARRTGQGIICFISNSSYLSAPSFESMRRSLLNDFDAITIDNLNGDRDATGKRTPEGRPDPSVFSTARNPAGIAEGTAIATTVRLGAGRTLPVARDRVRHRDFWGQDKRGKLLEAIDGGPPYEPVQPTEHNLHALKPIRASDDYYAWPAVPDLAAGPPVYGLHEARGGGLIDLARERLEIRMREYLDPDLGLEDLPQDLAPLKREWYGFDPKKVRDRLTGRSGLQDVRPFREQNLRRFLFKPLDVRWAYVEPTRGLWVAPEPQLTHAADHGAKFVYVRRTAENAQADPPVLLSRSLGDQHALHKTAYLLPTMLPPNPRPEEHDTARLWEDGTPPVDAAARPNLSQRTREWLLELGADPDDREQAELVWFHVLACAHAPAYYETFGEPMTQNYPRVPLPRDREALRRSAKLGGIVADLLDPEVKLPLLEADGVGRIGRAATVDGEPIATDRDLAVTVRWGYHQAKGAVMPGTGQANRRPYSEEEREALLRLAQGLGVNAPEAEAVLGEEVVDVALNERLVLAGIPAAAWVRPIGGFLPLKKWLSYRTEAVLGRALSLEELREASSIARRLSALVAVQPRLDESFGDIRRCPWSWGGDPTG